MQPNNDRIDNQKPYQRAVVALPRAPARNMYMHLSNVGGYHLPIIYAAQEKKDFLRSYFIADFYSFNINQLPETPAATCPDSIQPCHLHPVPAWLHNHHPHFHIYKNVRRYWYIVAPSVRIPLQVI